MRWSREDEKLSIGRYLEREGYSDAFRDNYLIVRDCYVALGWKSYLCALFPIASYCCCLEYASRQVCFRLPSANIGEIEKSYSYEYIDELTVSTSRFNL